MNQTILIIDVDTASRKHLRDMITAHGYSVDIVDSAADALAAFDYASWPLVITPFAPSDAGEPTLVQALHALAPDTTVIALGDHEQATALAALRGGAADYLPLPLDESELVAALDRAWCQRRQRAPSRALQVRAARPTNGTCQPDLAATLAHEINNPLTPIIGLAEM